jgi:hypothetical protein
MQAREATDHDSSVYNRAARPEPTVGRLTLWFGVLAPPLAWAVQLFLDYYLSSLACNPGFTWVRWFSSSTFTVLIIVVTLLLALIALAAGIVSWRIWRRQGVEVQETVAGAAGRLPFMALGGMAMSGLFLLLIVLSGVPDLTLGCAT